MTNMCMGGRKQSNMVEDEMKKSFMRGVCQLNLEAMSIMKKPFSNAAFLTSQTGHNQSRDSHQYPNNLNPELSRQMPPF